MFSYKVKLQNIEHSLDLVRIDDDAVGWALSELIKNSTKQYFLHITLNDVRLDQLSKQLAFFAPELEVLLLPAWDCLPYDRVSPRLSLSSERIRTLIRLNDKTKRKASSKTLILTTINSALQKVPHLTKEQDFIAKAGESIEIEQVLQKLSDIGYRRSSTANNIGEFALRGSLIDIVTYNPADNRKARQSNEITGYRLDFFGNQLESIRIFDPATQISSTKIAAIELLPVDEVSLSSTSINNFRNNYRKLFGLNKQDIMYEAITSGRSYPGMEHWLPLFYEEKLVSIFEYFSCPLSQISIENKALPFALERSKTINEYYQTRLNTLKESANSGTVYNPLPPDQLYLDSKQLEQELAQKICIGFDNFDQTLSQRKLQLNINPLPDFLALAKRNNQSAFFLLGEFLQNYPGRKILIFCFSTGSTERISHLLSEYNLASIQINSNYDQVEEHNIGLISLPLNRGFYNEELIVISEAALLGEKISRKSSKKINERVLAEIMTLQSGELVVHREHGIGKFEGLQTINAGGLKNDFLKIAYNGGDNLFVPVQNIDLISRYGSNDTAIQLDRLGLASWKNRKERIKSRIKIVAEELIKIAAARKLKTAPILTPDPIAYQDFEDRFNFIETEDQLRTIEEIKQDLAKGNPMDRLVCGDVGFGKTEVAMRAAFIASYAPGNCQQTAIITPTTLLCRQHFHNFKQRFAETGLTIAELSRMTPDKAAKQIRQDLANGKIDIIIATHTLLNKSIKFKNLVLLIVDEEQHFGVAQKERLKELRNEVHILTLSATPIPRTLQMALSGVRELSLISTPPLDRLAIRSFVMPYDSVIVREAVIREYQRGGRTFFVVPRIKDIETLEGSLHNLLPEIKIRSAHGQMSPSLLDEIVSDFYDGKFDLLLSTTIIESGIDITLANTIIIYKAELFGLAQLYQLRGRVGRGKIRAYAYLMTSNSKILTDLAEKKLEVMQTLDGLGAGFGIASHDMEIRGSGDLLGGEQSGHIKETGIELYQELLEEEITRLASAPLSATSNKEEIINKDYSPQIKLAISLIIPEDYISDLGLRMSFYKLIGNIKTKEEKEQLKIEITDRFGLPPKELNNLLEVAYLKNLCYQGNIEKVEFQIGPDSSNNISISFKDNYFRDPDKLLALVVGSQNQVKLQGPKLLFNIKAISDQEKLEASFKIVKQITDLIS